ncbi:MAG: hypothetical protein KF773_05145 [Deltaproteobacteria bacterium]|nr:hypothetical protein [Deltaproteobacteria bacterium]
MPDRTLVASATNLMARGFLVVPTDRRSPAGEPTNGLFALARALHRVLAFKLPARAVAVIDAGAPAGWPPLLAQQLPALAGLLEALNLRVVVAPDEVHAVASYARAALDAGDDVIVAGVDKRYAQLVGERCWWYDANKDVRYTTDVVKKRFAVGPDRVAEWLALVGDEDALPGIAGIGAKGATGLLETYGSVAEAMAHLANVKGRTGNALRAAVDQVPVELARARLDTARPLPVPLSDLAWQPCSAATINRLYDQLGFRELLAPEGAQVRATVLETAADVAAAVAGFAGATVTMYAAMEDAEPIGDLAGIALATAPGEAVYVAFAGIGATHPPEVLRAWLEDDAAPKLGHDLGPAIVALARRGIDLRGVAGDAVWASHLTQPSNWAPQDLAIVAKQVLGRALPEEDAVRGVGQKRLPWQKIGVDRAAEYAAQHADAATAVWGKLAPGVSGELLAEYKALAETCVRMELVGLIVDPVELDGAQADFAVIEAELTAEIEKLAGKSFNINSSKQLGEVLFEQLKLPIVSHTKTGWSVANEALERIEHAHPIVPLVIRWRTLRRLRDAWIIALKACIAPDGRVHSRTHPARSFSGRLVNSNPDLGRVPGRTPEMARIRRAFVAPPGMTLLSVDYKQLGLHVLAHLTKDPALVEPLRREDDLHAITASALLEKPRDQLTKDDRQLGKVVNFATFAGQGASALALQLGVPAQEAKDLIARFDRTYAQVRTFQDEQLRLAKERGYIQTIAGRHWPVGGLESLDPHDRSYAERLARRGTHEGSVADVSRRGLLDADRALRAAGLAAAPLLQILDEVLFQVPTAELPEAARIAADAMRNAFRLEAPLRVSLKAGPNWADMAPLPLSSPASS